MMKKIYFWIVNILFTLVTLTVNGLANALPINGKGTGEISDQFSIFFVPAGYVFSIWGLIYIALLVFTVFQALKPQRENDTIHRISPWYWLASAANSIWIFLWHYEIFPVTLIAMIVLLVSLLAIYLELKKVQLSTAEKYAVRLPFSIYLGWITVATVANVTQVLYFLNWGGWGIAPEAWAAIMVGVAAILGGLMLLQEMDIAYVLVLIWSFVGIAVKHGDTVLVSNTALVASALLGIGVIAVGSVLVRKNI